MRFTIGIQHMTQLDYERLEIMSDGACDGRDVQRAIARAVSFAKAGFLAD